MVQYTKSALAPSIMPNLAMIKEGVGTGVPKTCKFHKYRSFRRLFAMLGR